MEKNPAELSLDLYSLLEPYPSEVRQRAVRAALTLLGEVDPKLGLMPPGAAPAAEAAPGGLGPRARRWTERHGVTDAMLDEVFHVRPDGVEVSAARVPGATRKEMTVNCYLLAGVRRLLAVDEASIDDADAIALCKRMGAYDRNNHTVNRNSVGNRMSGTRPTFMLTGPGEIAAADLIKRMATPGAL